MFRLREVSCLHTSCRHPREDEPCGRRPAAITAPSLNCRWYGWRQRTGPCPAADPNPEVRAASTLCCRLTAAALGLKETPSRWQRPTSSPSLVCDVAEISTEVTDDSDTKCMILSNSLQECGSVCPQKIYKVFVFKSLYTRKKVLLQLELICLVKPACFNIRH